MSNIEVLVSEPKISAKKENKEIPENLALLWGNLRFLKNKDKAKENPEEYRKRCHQAYKDMASFFISQGGNFIVDVNEIYRSYHRQANQEPLIVRREDPEKTAGLAAGMAVDLSFDPKVTGDRGDKYANCAIWPYGSNPVAGIKNSFLEGRGMAGPLVTILAARHNPKNSRLEEPEDRLMKVGDITREAVRIVSGEIGREDLEFIIVRMAANYFPEENLTEEERKEKPTQIFRAFSFKK